ncbi:hypothetical protein SRB5_36470 [Streptomyces sp. RB5]|uniref:PH domain-containing protein n=2 Tax=Streptomyces smaragdinus TaxID=2585196 RepID=A0A7K0CJ38_9ACTN|nr:hypothetical protein [Streptomyces smaragdinus]
MGALVRRYEVDRRRARDLSVVMAVLGPVGVVIGVMLALRSGQFADPAASNNPLPFVVAGLGAGAVIVGGLGIRSWLAYPDAAFEVYEHGLVRLRGDKRKAVRWEEVSEVADYSRTSWVGGAVSLSLRRADGTSFSATGLVEDPEHFVAAIHAAVAAARESRPR